MKTVVICGGGIIGCSIAYYLTKLEKDFAKVIIIERNEIAGHASGKAGGFLGMFCFQCKNVSEGLNMNMYKNICLIF